MQPTLPLMTSSNELQSWRRHTPLHSGGSSRANRRNSIISAAAAGSPADTKCQFSGLLPCSRPPFQREICEMCEQSWRFRLLFAFNQSQLAFWGMHIRVRSPL